MHPPAFAELEPWRQRLQQALPEYGLTLAEPALTRLARYLQAIAEANPRVRLVGSVEPDTLVRRHAAESLFLLTLGHEPGWHLVDVGSGAGFPGVALAVAADWLKTTLVESNQKKAAFLKQMVDLLELNATVAPVRLEECKPGWGGGERKLWTARALERMESFPARLAKHMAPADRAAFWVTTPMAELWRQRFAQGWSWGEARLIPGSRERVIVVAEKVVAGSVPRGT